VQPECCTGLPAVVAVDGRTRRGLQGRAHGAVELVVQRVVNTRRIARRRLPEGPVGNQIASRGVNLRA
jgi:hypothetical protein